MKVCKLYIDGKWVKAETKETFKSLNPATGRPICIVEKGGVKDVRKAIKAAEKAFKTWNTTPPPIRGKILFKAAQLFEKEKRNLAKTIALEVGKPLSEAEGEVQEVIDITYYMAGEGRRLFGHTTTSELKDKAAFTIRRPIGIVGLITPWNFPMSIAAWKISTGLICGNTLIFKPSSDSPYSAKKMVEIYTKAGIPKGVLNLVPGGGGTAGAELVKNEKIRGISFTGSLETGKWITNNAGVKRIGLELGGKNPIIVMDDADIDLAIDGILWGAFGTAGQRCTATSRVLVHKKIQRKLEKQLVKRANKLKIGKGTDPKTHVGPLVNKKALEKVHDYVELGKKSGAKALCGAKQLGGPGFFYPPTVFTNVKPNMKIAHDEIFGPVVVVIGVRDLRDAIKIANSTKYGLSSSIYTKDIGTAFKAMEGIEAGITYVNSSTIGSEMHLPFGGVKQTGNGTREAGIEGINEFTEIKTIYIDYSGKLQKAQGIKWGKK